MSGERPTARLASSIRSRVYQTVSGRSFSIWELSFSMEELCDHLEKQFESGMSWNNWGRGPGRWHMDHRIPCAAFDLSREDDFQACWSLDNLRPLWFRDNLRKGARQEVPGRYDSGWVWGLLFS